MWRKMVGIVLLGFVPLVGAIALPAQAAYERAAAEERQARRQSFPADHSGEKDPSESFPPVLVVPRHWTVEKLSRQNDVPDLKLRVLGKQASSPRLAPFWKLSGLDPLCNGPRIFLSHPFLVHLIGAHAPPAMGG